MFAEVRDSVSFLEHRNFQKDMYCQQISTSATRHEALRKIAEGKDAKDLQALRKETAKVEAMQHIRKFGQPGTAILRYMHGIGDQQLEKKEEKCGLVASLDGCRVPKLLVRKDTQVKLGNETDPPSAKRATLHMNLMFDYYGNKLILCQAPLPKEFNDHWMAIWQENVRIPMILVIQKCSNFRTF